MKIPFEKSPYNTDFLKKIIESEKHIEGAVVLKCEEDISKYLKNPDTDVQD